MTDVNSDSSATIYHVASLAGVSISTVSLALNSPDRVRTQTLERIMEAVDELGFTPKAEAVIRARQGVGRIGVIAPFTSFPSENGRRLNGIFRGLKIVGHEVSVFDQESAATSRLMSLPVARKVDGLIICSLPFDAEIGRRLVDRSTPTVVVEIPHDGLSSVIVDHHGGGVLVGQFLARRGHRRVAYLGHRQEHDYPSQSLQKLQGLTSALPTSPTVTNIDHDFDSAVRAGIEILSSEDRPSAVFAHDDVLASGVLTAARQLGVRVPEDVEVIGFNDSEIAQPLGLTTVAQPFEESGEIAARLLVEQISNPSVAPRSVTVGVALIERSTTRDHPS